MLSYVGVENSVMLNFSFRRPLTSMLIVTLMITPCVRCASERCFSRETKTSFCPSITVKLYRECTQLTASKYSRAQYTYCGA